MAFPKTQPAAASRLPDVPPVKPQTVQAPPPPAPPTPPEPSAQTQHVINELKLLDTFIVGELENWMRDELPVLVVREIARLNERLRNEAIAHARATLLPKLSEHIAEQIKQLGQQKK
jgi:hypothetical protein